MQYRNQQSNSLHSHILNYLQMESINNFKLLTVLSMLPFGCYYVPLFDTNGKTIMSPAFTCLPNLKLCLNEASAKITECSWCKNQIKYNKFTKVQSLQIKQAKCGHEFLIIKADRIESQRCGVIKLDKNQIHQVHFQMQVQNLKESSRSEPYVLNYMRSLKMVVSNRWLSPAAHSDFKLHAEIVQSLTFQKKNQVLCINYGFASCNVQKVDCQSLLFRRGRWVCLQSEGSWTLVKAFDRNLKASISRSGEGWLALDQNYYYVLSQTSPQSYSLEISQYNSTERYTEKIIDIKRPERAVLICNSTGLTFVAVYAGTILFKNIYQGETSELQIPSESLITFQNQGLRMQIQGRKYWTNWQTAGQLSRGIKATIPLTDLQS